MNIFLIDNKLTIIDIFTIKSKSNVLFLDLN